MLLAGDIGPRTTGQTFLASVLTLFGALIIAIMFGEMSVLMSNLNRKSTQFQENQDTANTTMKNMKLPEDLQIQINEYLIYTHNMLDSQSEYEEFQQIISPSIKNAVSNVIYSRIIELNTIFKENPAVAEFITKKLENVFVKPEKDIILQGEIGDRMFFLAKGECEVFVKDEYKEISYVSTLKPGTHFGEVSLVCKIVRSATVKAKNYSTVAELSQENFHELVNNFPEVLQQLRQDMSKYQDK